MAEQRINFFTEDIDHKITKKQETRAWLQQAIRNEGKRPGDINFIFCSDSYLLTLNQEYLDHDTYTDIITFDNSDNPRKISGDIFISVERVKENAAALGLDLSQEMRRVMIHGILHLVGFKDKTPAEKALMRAKEDHYILEK